MPKLSKILILIITMSQLRMISIFFNGINFVFENLGLLTSTAEYFIVSDFKL